MVQVSCPRMLKSWKFWLEVRDHEFWPKFCGPWALTSMPSIGAGAHSSPQHKLLVLGEFMIEAQRVNAAELGERKVAVTVNLAEQTKRAADRTLPAVGAKKCGPNPGISAVSGLLPVIATGPLVPDGQCVANGLLIDGYIELEMNYACSGVTGTTTSGGTGAPPSAADTKRDMSTFEVKPKLPLGAPISLNPVSWRSVPS